MSMNMELPKWMEGCWLAEDWVYYKSKVYFASLNYEASEKKGKPVFDLAYCATQAMNGIFERTNVSWHPNKFKPYKK